MDLKFNLSIFFFNEIHRTKLTQDQKYRYYDLQLDLLKLFPIQYLHVTKYKQVSWCCNQEY